MSTIRGVYMMKNIYNSDVFNWAISQSDRPFEDVKKRFPKIETWKEGVQEPTVKQLKNLSRYLHVPFGSFFLYEVPKEDSFMVEYRTIQNKTVKDMSRDLKEVILDVTFKQDWMSEYRKKNGFDSFHTMNELKQKSPLKIAETLFEILNLEPGWNLKEKSPKDVFDKLRDIIENNLQVVVMVNGQVKNNTKRQLDIQEFRAFALYDIYAPFIFINTKDARTGMVFSLIHELIHILMGEDDLATSYDALSQEQRINAAVANFLMPKKVIDNLNQNTWDIEKVKKYAKEFNISSHAFAIRLVNLGYVDQDLVAYITSENEKILEVKRKDTSGGPDFSVLKKYRMGNKFTETVILAAESGSILHRDAFKLLGVKSKIYDKIKQEVGL